MNDNLISVIDFANQQGAHKQTIFKILKRVGVEPEKRPGANSRGQTVSYITQEQARIVEENLHFLKTKNSSLEDANSEPSKILEEQGVFYLLRLEPNNDPGRFKVGFAASLPERLRQLRCSAPFIEVVATWQCKRLWEKTAIDCVTQNCERLHTEIFRTTDITVVREKCARFFDLMPKLSL